MHSIGDIWCDWMVICLLQTLEQQSNFGNTLECVGRVERTSNSVGFALVHVWECIVVLALLCAPCCSIAGVVFVCTLAMHACML